jgi:malate dehydrogenase (oxaloacetate-decarboxylating)(NADP+)
MIRKEDALLYHSMGRRGKLEVVPTKPVQTQRDLSLAYSPGVAEPCREISRTGKYSSIRRRSSLMALPSPSMELPPAERSRRLSCED